MHRRTRLPDDAIAVPVTGGEIEPDPGISVSLENIYVERPFGGSFMAETMILFGQRQGQSRIS